tara:strand:+ start:2883 stop:5219 length:2337 start_codon:yes stop_codon:yes gene_type:complete
MVIKKIFRLKNFIIVFFLLTTFSQAEEVKFKPADAIEPYCSGYLDLKNNLVLEKLEIRVNKNKRWSKNLLNLHVYFQDEKAKSKHSDWFANFRINQKYKKKFKSKILVKYKGFKSCYFNSMTRVTGDLWWHIGWNRGTPVSSLHVEILDGHINNITRFKLLLPQSRNNENEVFTAVFLKNLGFLSPRTFLIQAKVNGFKGNYIFQEDLRKEFLENLFYREGPILEGDERFTIMLKDKEDISDKKANLAKLINKNYAMKNSFNSYVSLKAVSNLNLLYLHNHNASFSTNLENKKLFLLTKELFNNEENIKQLATYESLIYALDAGHSLSFDDRRFYYNSIERSFIPIYYDGKSQILNSIQRMPESALQKYVSEEAKEGSLNAIKKISQIDKKALLNELIISGLNLNKDSLDKVMDKIIKRLQIINTAKPLKVKISDKSKYFSKFSAKDSLNKRLVFSDFQLNEFYICDFKLDVCKTIRNRPLQFKRNLAEAISQNFNFLKDQSDSKIEYIFVYDDLNYEKESFLHSKELLLWKSIIVDSVLIQYNKDIDLEVNNQNKIILITQKHKNGLVIFKNGELKDWKIKFNGTKNVSTEKTANLNPMNLTGCLNTYNVKLTNVSFDIRDTFCEDSVNLIKTDGNIDLIEVKNSISDSIDMDFSNLLISKIVVSNSLNDCLDLSYGNYEIKEIKVKKCGDKGVSVGEKSNVEIHDLNASETKIAVASKDSSILSLHSAFIAETPLCFAAYRKKQEFSGGKILVKNTNCDKNNFYTTKDSRIFFNEL